MRRHYNGPNAYIIARVFRLASGQPAVRFFPNPYQWYSRPGDLRFNERPDMYGKFSVFVQRWESNVIHIHHIIPSSPITSQSRYPNSPYSLAIPPSHSALSNVPLASSSDLHYAWKLAPPVRILPLLSVIIGQILALFVRELDRAGTQFWALGSRYT